MPIETATKLKSVMPKGLPKTKPPMIPRLFAPVKFCAQSAPITMPVFASAKIGKITNATGLCKKCSSWCEGDSSSSSLAENGIVNASNTPAMVA